MPGALEKPARKTPQGPLRTTGPSQPLFCTRPLPFPRAQTSPSATEVRLVPTTVPSRAAVGLSSQRYAMGVCGGLSMAVAVLTGTFTAQSHCITAARESSRVKAEHGGGCWVVEGQWGPRVGRVQEHPPTAGMQGCSLPRHTWRLSPGIWQSPQPPTPPSSPGKSHLESSSQLQAREGGCSASVGRV